MPDQPAGCKFLDFTLGKYTDCELSVIPGTELSCWKRGPTWAYYPGAPVFVQFCGQGRGRINNPLACYGEMHCYHPPGEKGEGRG